MKNVKSFVRAGMEYAIGLAVVCSALALVLFLNEFYKIKSQPQGWLIIRGSGEVSALLEVGDIIWAGGKNGILRIDRKSRKVLPTLPDMPPLSYIKSIKQSANGDIWIVHDLGLSSYGSGNWKNYSTKELGLTGPALSLLPEANDVVLVGGEGGLVKWMGEESVKINLPSDPKVTQVSSLYRDSTDRLWVGSNSNTNGALLSFSKPTGWQHYKAGEEIFHNSITDILEDKSGQIWITSGFAGRGAISRFASGNWQKIMQTNKFVNRKSRSVFEDREGRLWVGYEYDGLGILENGIWHFLTDSDGLAGSEIKAVIQDSRNDYWIATRDGLSVITNNSWKLDRTR